jgi:pyruvate/2-oxoglutarate/acetoin dehydrogenase E1 component
VSQTYIAQITEQVNAVTRNCGPVLLYGENIDTGSRIAGLARGLEVNPAGKILNVGNCELTHVGLGLGMLLDGGSAVQFMKQLDFLLLGIDQMVNTFNFIRATRPRERMGSFTIYPIVCDQGWQGPQSSISAAGDFASLANIDVFCLNSAAESRAIVRERLVQPGFRVICVSQRLFGAPALQVQPEAQTADHGVFKYRSGDDLTIACFSFALRDGLDLADRLAAAGVRSDVFHVNYVPSLDRSLLAESCARTRRLVLLDDSKSVAKLGDALATDLRSSGLDFDVLPLGRRGTSDAEYGVAEDRFLPDADAVLAFARAASSFVPPSASGGITR